MILFWWYQQRWFQYTKLYCRRFIPKNLHAIRWSVAGHFWNRIHRRHGVSADTFRHFHLHPEETEILVFDLVHFRLESLFSMTIFTKTRLCSWVSADFFFQGSQKFSWVGGCKTNFLPQNNKNYTALLIKFKNILFLTGFCKLVVREPPYLPPFGCPWLFFDPEENECSLQCFPASFFTFLFLISVVKLECFIIKAHLIINGPRVTIKNEKIKCISVMGLRR